MKNEYTEVEVDVLSISVESKSWLIENMPIIYKSDTEGLDIAIASNLNNSFWKKVQFGFIEITQTDYIHTDENKLVSILDNFNNKLFASNLNKNLTSKEITDYLKNDNRNEVDLFFWKD